MGWFSNAFRNLRPDKVISNPQRMGQMMLDPAGTIVRGGRGGNMPNNARSVLDPGGFFTQEQQQAAPSSYQPRQRMTLSPAAQQLYDQMMARSAARQAQAGQAQAPQGTFNGRPIPAAPAPTGGTLAALARGAARRSNDMYTGSVGKYADGGKVTRPGFDADHVTYKTKVINRKPNGKPC